MGDYGKRNDREEPTTKGGKRGKRRGRGRKIQSAARKDPAGRPRKCIKQLGQEKRGHKKRK